VTVQSPLAETTSAVSVISVTPIKVEQIAVDQEIEPVLVNSEAPVIVQKIVKRISVEQYLKTKLVATTKLTTDDKIKAENGLPSEITVDSLPINPVAKVMKWGLVRLSLPEKNNQLATVVEQQDVGFPRVVDPRRNGAVHICQDEISLYEDHIDIPFNENTPCLKPVTVQERVQCVTNVTEEQKDSYVTPVTVAQEAPCFTPVTVRQETQGHGGAESPVCHTCDYRSKFHNCHG